MFENIFSNCTADVTFEDIQNMKDSIAPLSIIFKREGRLLESDFDIFDIPTIEQNRKKDVQCLNRQRSLFFNTENVQTYFQKWQNDHPIKAKCSLAKTMINKTGLTMPPKLVKEKAIASKEKNSRSIGKKRNLVCSICEKPGHFKKTCILNKN